MPIYDGQIIDTLLVLAQAFSLIIGIAYAWLFLHVFKKELGSRYKKRFTNWGKICVYAATLANSFFFGASAVSMGSLNWIWLIIEAVILLAYLMIFCRGSALHKLFWLFIMIVFYTVSILSASLLCGIFQTFRPDFIEGRFLAHLEWMMALAIFAGASFLLASQKKHRAKMSPVAMLILSFTPLLSCLILYAWSDFGFLSNSSSTTSLSEWQAILEIAAVVGIGLINLVVFVLYDYILTRAERSFEQENMLQQAELMQIHYNELQSLYRETRVWRHDYANHLQAIEGHLVSSNIEDLAAYLGELKGSLDLINYRVKSGDELLDAILSAKISDAESRGISFNVEIKAPISESVMSMIDATSLIGNLADNAIEACERMQDESKERSIVFKVSQSKSQILLYFRNTMEGEVQATGEGGFSTSKTTGDHGIGTQRIASIVKKYGGQIDNEISDGYFTSYITVPLKIDGD